MPTTAANVSALARCLGVSRAAVRAWLQRDDWTCGDAPWDVAAVRRWRSATLDPPGGGAATAEERAARIALLVERMARLALDSAILRGELVRLDAVRRDWKHAVETAKARLLAVAWRVAMERSPDDDTERRRIEAAIDREIRAALNRLAAG